MSLLDSLSIAKDIFTLKKDDKKLQSKKKSSRDNTDIYNSNTVKKNIKMLTEKGKKRISAARDPRKTGVINPMIHRTGTNKRAIVDTNADNIEQFGNLDSEFSDESSYASSNSSASVMGDPSLLLTRASKLVDNRLHERKIVDKRGGSQENSYLSQFDSLKFNTKGGPVSMNAVDENENLNTRIQTERDLALKGAYSNFGEGFGNHNDMTYGVTDDMTHDNMVPQFKSKSYGSQPNRDEKYQGIAQRKMELFTGSSVIKPQKTENKPLFDPVMNATNIFGSPVMIDAVSDRYIPSNEKRNELPFQQKRVTPGLNLGYNEINPMGENYRPVYKTIDELRTADQAQISYTAPVVTSGLRGHRGAVIGAQAKHRPERTKEWGTERMVKNFGYVYAPSIYGNFDPKNLATINRGLSKTMYVGPAQHEVSQVTPTELREQFGGSFKQNFKEAHPRNLHIVEGQQARGNEDGDKSWIPDPTQRSQELNHMGPAGDGQIGKTRTYDPNDVIDPTQRDVYNKYDRLGTAITGSYSKNKTYDPNDIFKTTMRDIHNIYDRDGVAITGDHFKGHKYDPNDVPDPTRRDIHNRYDRDGVAITGDHFKGHKYDPNDVPDPTRRDIHNRYDRDGVAVTGNYFKGHKYDPNDVPDVTNREMYSKLERSGGGAGNNEIGKSYTINYDLMTPDVTNREIHSKLERTGGGAGNNEIGKSYTINYDLMTPDVTNREMHSKLERTGGGAGDNQNSKSYVINYDLATPDVTKREIHSKLERTGGGAGNSQIDKGYVINYDLATPDVTKREIHSKLDRTGGGAGANNTFLTRTRADYENAQMNVGKEQIEIINRPPTYSNYSKGPTMDFTMFRTCDKIQINRAALPTTITTSDKLPFTMASGSNLKTIENTRIDSHTKMVLDGNPYINNIIHKAL